MAGAVERRERQGPVEPSCQGRDQEQWHDEQQPDSEQSVGLVSEDNVDTVDQPVMNRRAYYNRLQNAEICLERFNIFILIQTSDQKLILEPNQSKGLSVW